MADAELLSLGCGIFFLAVAGLYVGVRARFQAAGAELGSLRN